jgi:hypothetical protein
MSGAQQPVAADGPLSGPPLNRNVRQAADLVTGGCSQRTRLMAVVDLPTPPFWFRTAISKA